MFESIQGEGVRAGVPVVFVRLQGCNFFPNGCSYCDTQYAANPEGGKEMSIDAVVAEARSYECSYVCISGGEPLLQMSAVAQLVDTLGGLKVKTEVETNGSILPIGVCPSFWDVDVKCPSSGPAYGSFRMGWLRKMRKKDQLKFVVGTEEDLDFVRGFLNGSKTRPQVLVSPVIKSESDVLACMNPWLQRVAEFCKEQNVRYSLQIHKVIWGNKRGV